jgi:hypothetical protein
MQQDLRLLGYNALQKVEVVSVLRLRYISMSIYF